MKESLIGMVAIGLLSVIGIEPVMATDGILQAEQQQQAKTRAKEMEQTIQAPSVILQSQKSEVPIKKVPLPYDEVAFAIRHILVKSEAPQLTVYQDKLAVYEERRIGAKGINALVMQLTDALVADGFITTQVSVPDQDITSGSLILEIHPGRVETIRFSKPVTWGTWRNAFPIGKGDILNVRALEQGLEQMKRVSNQDVSMKLLPGTDKYSTIVELTRTESAPFTIGLSVTMVDIKQRDNGKAPLVHLGIIL